MTYAIELNHDQSRRIVQGACQAQQPMHLLPKAWIHARELQGTLRDCDDDTIRTRLSDSGDPDLSTLLNTYCQIVIPMYDGEYFFDSHVLSVRCQEGSAEISLARPRTIVVAQRRQSRRKVPAQASMVQMSRQEGDDLWTCEGQLYNLSEVGLACQLQRRDTAHLAIGQTWWACFEIPGHAHVFKIEGTVRRLLPSSSEHALIMGMEFEKTALSDADLRQLSEYLNHRQHCGATAGVNI